MTKPMYFIGTCVLVTAAAIFVWSHSAAGPGAHTASSTVGSSTETTINDNKPLPVEQWDAF